MLCVQKWIAWWGRPSRLLIDRTQKTTFVPSPFGRGLGEGLTREGYP